MAKRIARSSVWLAEDHSNIAHQYTLVDALEHLFGIIEDGKIDWSTFRVEHEMIGSHHPEGIAADIGFSAVYEYEEKVTGDSSTGTDA